MLDGAILYDRAYFDSPEWLLQARNGGFSRGPAWVDLLAITNATATETLIRGIHIPIERGQCAWSKLGLSKRWGRSQAWVATTLAAWENAGRIELRSNNETTLITVLNYDDWQTGLLSLCNPHREQTENKPRTEREQSETEKGEGRKEVPKSGEGRRDTIPSEDDVLLFGSGWPGDMRRGIPAGIPEGWLLSWYAWRIEKRDSFPQDWQADAARRFVTAWVTGDRRARAGLAGQNEKNGGESVAQQLYKLDRKLRELDAQLEAYEDTQPDLAERLKKERAALRAQRKDLAG